MKNKILISDYDGTFDAGNNISQNIKAIKRFRKMENLFILATGRSLPSIKEEIIKYQIPFDYLIIDNGATLLDNNLDVLNTVIIDKQDYLELRTYLDSKNIGKENMIFYTTLDCNVDESVNEFTKIEVKLNSLDAINNLYLDYKKNIKLLCYLLASHFAFELMAKGVDKARAIKWLENYLDNDNIYVIGNSNNDIPMLKAYRGYSVYGSTEDVMANSLKVFRTVEDCINYLIDKNS